MQFYLFKSLFKVALTDGHSVMLDVNGKPFMHLKGIVAQNIQSSWRILCDDSGDFHTNGSQIANDICKIIGFMTAKEFKVVEMTTSATETQSVDDSKHTIDIRNSKLKHKENISETHDGCQALEIECGPFQSHSFAIHPMQHNKIKKTSASGHQKGNPDFAFGPKNSSDHKEIIVRPINTVRPDVDHSKDFTWPWNAEIYVNGELVAIGILLDKSWVMVENTCFGNVQDPLHFNHVVVMLGNSKAHIHGPYEQISKVNCLSILNDTNVLLLHLEHAVTFNRHVLPAFLPIL